MRATVLFHKLHARSVVITLTPARIFSGGECLGAGPIDRFAEPLGAFSVLNPLLRCEPGTHERQERRNRASRFVLKRRASGKGTFTSLYVQSYTIPSL